MSKNAFWNWVAPAYDLIFTPFFRDLKFIRALGRFKRNDRVLDFGGGTGRVADSIRNEVAEIIVADVAPQMLERAARKGLTTYLVTDVPTAFAAAHFDKVLIIEALHHIPKGERAAYLHEVRRLMKRNGVLVIGESQLGGILKVLALERLFDKNVFYDAPEALDRMLGEAGFKIEERIAARPYYFVKAVAV